MRASFGLVLMVTRACNLRCGYCYTGRKRPAAMRAHIARAAIDRAINSLGAAGTLELGFFGGEPLLEAPLILDLIDYARSRTADSSLGLRLALTTNGTVTNGDAWAVMSLPEIELSVSHDGLAEVHDRYRRDCHGRGTSARVLHTINRLIEAGRDPNVVIVVRPDTAPLLGRGIAFLRSVGVRRVEPALDLWTEWRREDGEVLRVAIAAAADAWAAGLPGFEAGWFVEKAVRMAGLPIASSARCGFGDGQVAVAPSGNLYPCERLIGEDQAANPTRLPGHVLQGTSFHFSPAPSRALPACTGCAIGEECNTTCRCSNYVRTGDVSKPDGLLCLLDQVCHRETARVLGALRVAHRLPVLVN